MNKGSLHQLGGFRFGFEAVETVHRFTQSGGQGSGHARCVFGAKRIQINGQCRLLLRPRRCFFRRFLQRFHGQIVQAQQCGMVQAACNGQCGGGKRLAVFQRLEQQLGGFVFQLSSFGADK